MIDRANFLEMLNEIRRCVLAANGEIFEFEIGEPASMELVDEELCVPEVYPAADEQLGAGREDAHGPLHPDQRPGQAGEQAADPALVRQRPPPALLGQHQEGLVGQHLLPLFF